MEDDFVSKLRKFSTLSFQFNFGTYIYNSVFEPQFLAPFIYLSHTFLTNTNLNLNLPSVAGRAL